MEQMPINERGQVQIDRALGTLNWQATPVSIDYGMRAGILAGYGEKADTLGRKVCKPELSQ